VASGRRAFEYGTVCAIVLTVMAISGATQDRIVVNGGRGYDGAHYYELGQQLVDGERPHGESRFARRVGTALLAARVHGSDLVSSFFIVNGCAALLSTLLLFAWLGRYVGGIWLRLGLVLLHATHWLQLVRFTTFYPVLVDACAQVCCFAGLIGIASYEERPRRWKILALALLAAGGVWFREVVLLIPLAFLVVRPAGTAGPEESPATFAFLPRPRLWVPLIFAAASLGLLESFVVATDPAFSESHHLLGRAASRSLLPFVLGWMVAFGPMLAVILFDWPHALDFLRRHRWMLVYVLLVAGIGWAGSLESERHALNWATPVVFALAGRAVERSASLTRVPALVMLVLIQLIVNRVFWVVPQPAEELLARAPTIVLTAVGPDARYLDLFPAYMPRNLAWLQLLQHVAAALVVLWMLRARSLLQDAAAIVRKANRGRQSLRTALASLYAAAGRVRHLRLRHALKAGGPAFLAGSSLGALTVFIVQPDRPIPIHIRWTGDTHAALRTALERRWRLSDSRRTEGSTFAYLLADPSTDRIRDIVRHPRVDDTAHINRRWFRPELRYDRSRLAALLAVLLGSACAATMLARAGASLAPETARRRGPAMATADGDRPAAPGPPASLPEGSPCYPPPESGRGRNAREALGSDDVRTDVGGQRRGSAGSGDGAVTDA
jgi:hypothetical protein